MALRFYNTISRSKEEFTPLDGKRVRMYTCGPTVYNFSHIGNLRTFLFEDILNRYLTYKGYDVTQVMNLTDIDDKTIQGCQAENISLSDFTARYKASFFEDIDTLNIKRATHYPSATEHVDEMVEIIKSLLDKGVAYKAADNSVYFKISAFPTYGKLSHMKLDELRQGASQRVASDEYEKDQASDFALWKAWDKKDGDVFWENELGKGRPGWHIECSAMSMKYLDQSFDIHTGAVDNIFPHHENEIAQSEAHTGKPFSTYWLHAAHLIVDGRKMSKSLGNYYTLRDVLDKGFAPLAIRFILISKHYRQQLNFTFDGLNAAKEGVKRYNDCIHNLSLVTSTTDGGEANGFIEKAKVDFETALDDDLNMSAAFGVVFDFIRDINRLKADDKLSKTEAESVLETIFAFDTVFGLRKKEEASLDSDIEALITKREEARKNKDWAESDRIRDELSGKGIILEDTPQGTIWKREL